jgi:hypothetical protein
VEEGVLVGKFISFVEVLKGVIEPVGEMDEVGDGVVVIVRFGVTVNSS